MHALLFIFIISVPAILTQDPRHSTEHYCYVQSPIDLSIFNLTAIQHDDNDSIIRINETEHLRVHFCKSLNDRCNGKQDYAICLHSNDKEIGVGREPPDVAINSGKIMFRYTGDKCNKTHNYNVDVEMKCHFSHKEKVATNLDIVYNRDECSFQISIKTFAACSKRKLAKCELRDKTGYYNLSPLMNLEDNYKIKVDNSTSVILNVCHSLIYGHHFHQCDHDTMVCLVNETDNKPPSYTRLGNVNDEMRFITKNGSVLLELTSDTPCGKEDATKLKTVRTTIEFVCNERATTTMPEYKSGLGTCHYRFRWPTVTACSEDVLIRLSNLEHQPCKITDSANNLYYDLSTLAGNVAYVNSSDNKREYEFSICSPLKNSNCTKTGTGVCKYIVGKDIAVSKGQANTNLMWKRNQIYLNYTDGVACGNNLRSYTLIIFKCSRTNNSLIIDDKDPCATVIIWTSATICKCTYEIDRLMEVLEPDNLYHWTVLSRHHMNYVVKGETNTTQYHLNVGMPLVEDQFTNCTNDSSACRVIIDNEGKRISELNLGSQDTDTHISKDGDMYLRYRNGSICEEDNSKRISAKVFFICDSEAHAVKDLYFNLDTRFPSVEFLVRFLKIVQGKPTFKKYSNCKYEFDWVTTHACFFDNAEMGVGCQAANNAVAIFNFTYLIKNELFKVNADQHSGHFSAKHCEDLNKCNGTFICNNWQFPENDVKVKPDTSKPLIAFKFVNETVCKKDTYYKSVMDIWCGLWSGIAEVFLLNEEECSIGLNWDEYITDCHLNGDITDGDNSAGGQAHFMHPFSYGYIAMYSTVFAVIIGFLLYACCRKRLQRLFSKNDRRNYDNNISYENMREMEPVADLDLQE